MSDGLGQSRSSSHPFPFPLPLPHSHSHTWCAVYRLFLTLIFFRPGGACWSWFTTVVIIIVIILFGLWIISRFDLIRIWFDDCLYAAWSGKPENKQVISSTAATTLDLKDVTKSNALPDEVCQTVREKSLGSYEAISLRRLFELYSRQTNWSAADWPQKIRSFVGDHLWQKLTHTAIFSFTRVSKSLAF